jgi:hypothetical protein
MTSYRHLMMIAVACLLTLGLSANAAVQTKPKPPKGKPAPSRKPATAKPQTSAAKPKPSGAGATLFVISQDRTGSHMEPLVGIIDGRYIEPPAGESELFAQFVSRYYRAGQKYRVLFGGGDAGTLTVKAKPDPDNECARAQASVEMQATVRIGGLVMGLATNSETLGRKAVSRRFPTAVERTSLTEIGKNIFRQKGVPTTALDNLQTINMTATDLNGDGRIEIIASFMVRTEQKSAAVHHLFVIAAAKGDAFDVDLLRYSRTTKGDLPEGTSLADIDQALLSEVLIDQLDLDGDKMGEVVTLTTSFEGATYKIYRKQKGQWASVYEFYSYRCAY